MVRLSLHLLGGFEARLASGAPVSLPTRKAQALLAYLGARPGQVHQRDKLAALLWGEASNRRARGSLRHVVADLRKALAGVQPAVLRILGKTLSLDPDGVDVDVVAFERLVEQATPRALEEAADIYRGDLLLGFELDEPLFEDWLVAERERLREMALETLARLLASQSRAAAVEPAIRTALRLLALDPLQEAVHRTLMQLYVRQGRRGAALRQYQLCVDVLQRELGAVPEMETRTLYREILRRRVEAPHAASAGGGAAELATAGERMSLELPAAEVPLVGRQADLEQLQQRLREALEGHGHVATVVGETGIGKTRLVSTLAAEALSRGCRVLIGRCHESDAILPFAPWVDALRSSQLAADEALLAALHPARRAELARLLPEVGTPGLPSPSDSPLPLFESVADLLGHAAVRRPLVLILEDLHWADEMSLRLLAFVSRRVPPWPALVIATARDEDLADNELARRTVGELSRAPHATRLRLAPLSRADIALIVRALARVGRDVAALERGIWAMSEGNPLVAVEAMLALAEDAAGSARDGAAELSLPERVRELIAQRLDRIGARSQPILAAAAVIGRRFDFPLLRAVTGMDDRQVAEAVEDMVRNHVLRAVGDQLEFTHDRVRDVAYARLLPPRRRLLHAAVAAALEGAGGESRSRQIAELAYHAVRGDLGEQAVRYLHEAGVRAAARSALQDARSALEQALALLPALPERHSTLELAFDVRLALRPVLLQLGELRLVLDLLREAEALARRLDDPRRQGQVCAFLTNIHTRLDDPDAALETGGRALEIADRLDDSRLRILARTYLAQACYCRGEYSRAIDLAASNLAALPAEWTGDFLGGSQPPSVNDRFRLVASLAHLGRFDEALGYEREILRLAEATGHAYPVAVACHAVATIYLVRGDWEKARALIERQIAVLREGNIHGELAIALANSALALARLGHQTEAVEHCLAAERLLGEHAARGAAGAGWVRCTLGRAYLVLGRPDEAHRLATASMEPASSRTDFVPDTLHLLGEVAVHPSRFDAAEAEARYCQALALAERRGMRPLLAHCHLGLGRLWARTGLHEPAAERLDAAAALYRDMQMGYWLEQLSPDSAAPRNAAGSAARCRLKL